jgi:hypothetical protein
MGSRSAVAAEMQHLDDGEEATELTEPEQRSNS